MFSYLIIVKIISLISVMFVILLIALCRYKKDTMKYQFEKLLGVANAFISGLLLTSSLVYLLPESYNLHIQHNADAINSFPWIFSVFSGSFGLISILTQFYTFDKYFRKRIVSEYFSYDKNEQEQYNISEIYDDESQFKVSHQLHHNQHHIPNYQSVQRNNFNRFSQNLQNPKDSYLTSKMSYSISGPACPQNGKGVYIASDDENHMMTPYQDVQDQKYEYQNYKPHYLYLIYCIHSFFECSAIGLQKDILPTIMISISIFLHKWFEVLFIQMQAKFSLCKAYNSNYYLIVLYTLSNIAGIGFGWLCEHFFSSILNAVFVSISGGTFFAISINDLLHAEINKGNKYRFLKILLFLISIGLINLAWYAQKQINEDDS